ncbi:glucosamine 6-phosphate synthetase-like amidotransferase/phosphosugar isomerase protein [Spinactinospora alkalitolerans]|uniref:Glucosamine 6-phosphate synthetase-like amidotransferase/phosphosugar isomerase protein n=1 Tax=Spinactinospora alkalitolerans TaxID=687207 RepID=A0A852TX07_9ACTN|nr:SIS domain-containing protein [Spinactinospora alkalitolerans]NYE48549.1 glucosamine 6-phosphate synthetase-like amidotransferase/phosphosugar isomerase protein [Spinactinospora alkalitolerans]
MTAQRLAADLAGKPAALTELADHLARRDPYAALPSLIDDEPANVVLLGMGASRHACDAAAARMRSAGLGATAEYASAHGSVPGGPDTLVVAVSLGEAQHEICAALDRYAGESAIIVLADGPESPVARYADVLVPLLAGREDSGLACRGYQHALALLLLLAGRLGAVPAGASGEVSVTLRRVANASADLLERADTWVPRAAALLKGTAGLHLVAPAERLASAGQAALAIRRGPVLAAHTCETGEWSYTDRYLAAIEDYRAVLFAGSRHDERVAEHLLQLSGSFLAVGGDVDGAAMSLRYLGDTDPDVSLLTEPLVGELLAAHWWAGRPV